MQNDNVLEVWMRGPVPDVPGLLQPVAHAFLQAEEDVRRYVHGLTDAQLWIKPFGVASVGFHLQHISGVIDRMFTYARNSPLSDEQFDALNAEGIACEGLTTDVLLRALRRQIEEAIRELQDIDTAQLTAVRFIGRKRIPTTLIGLLFHAAEHTQRHVGQLIVTVRSLKS